MTATLGNFWGIGVGPGPAGYLPLAALSALQQAELIFAPRASSAEASVALQCLQGINIDASRLREIEFNMDPDRSVLQSHYATLAQTIANELRAGRSVAYLTIGDTLTYSTYSYILAALCDLLPTLSYRTFPGRKAPVIWWSFDFVRLRASLNEPPRVASRAAIRRTRATSIDR